jgi:hypothetical protein
MRLVELGGMDLAYVEKWSEHVHRVEAFRSKLERARSFELE